MGGDGLHMHDLIECWLQTNICLHSCRDSEYGEVMAGVSVYHLSMLLLLPQFDNIKALLCEFLHGCV